MKITWFGGTTLRIHIGGEILVCDVDRAPAGVDRRELLSGADKTFAMEDSGSPIDAASWRPRRLTALLDEAPRPEVTVHAVAPSSKLVNAMGEPPLLLLSAEIPAGRWARDAVVVVFSSSTAAAALATLAPRLIALAMDEEAAAATVPDLRDSLGGTALVALEPGMALEI